jgi:hypothetical protein
MSRLYVNQTLERQIRQYCELNEIDDINAFANRCLSQGFSIIKFGTSPRDNVEREINGIKDLSKDEYKKQTKPSREEESKRRVEETVKEPTKKENMEEKEEIKDVKTPVTVRKIQIIKKS